MEVEHGHNFRQELKLPRHLLLLLSGVKLQRQILSDELVDKNKYPKMCGVFYLDTLLHSAEDLRKFTHIFLTLYLT